MLDRTTTICKPTIYFAGKIAHDDWRTQIFGSRFGAAPNDGADDYGFDRLLDETLVSDCGSFLYGGPFFISCDHGCAHATAGHGASPSGCLTGQAPDGRHEIRERIWWVNCARIRRADYVFAFLNETDCFGTLIELGYAAARDKQVCVAFGRAIRIEDYDELWMARQCHNFCSAPLLGEPTETFHTFLRAIRALV